jgi:hypothetical protein
VLYARLMASQPHIIDPFHLSLWRWASEQIDDRLILLGGGGAQTWEQYHGHVGYIQALNDVLEKCRQIEQERYGTRPSEDKEVS